MSGKTKKKVVLKRNKKLQELKPGSLWHPETGLVLESNANRSVIGKYVEDDNEFTDLNEDMIEVCEQYGFKYDESLLQGTAEETAEETVEEEEVEEGQGEEEEEEKETEETKEEVVPTTTGESLVNFDSLYESFGKEVRTLLGNSESELRSLREENETLKKELEEKTKEADAASKKMAQLKALFS